MFLKWGFARKCSKIGKVRFCQNSAEHKAVYSEGEFLKLKELETPRTLILLMSWFPHQTLNIIHFRSTVNGKYINTYKYINKKNRSSGQL